MRRFAISDIHGCCKTFKAALTNIIKLQKDDQLFILGDYIDRGPDSKEVFDHIWELQNAGYEIHCLMGNHEDMLLKALDGGTRATGLWLMNGGRETLHSFDVSSVNDIPEQYIEFIKQLDLYIELDDYWLVHAGLNFLDPKGLFADRDAMLWIRRWYKEIDWKVMGKRTVVHGHTPVTKAHIEERMTIVKSLPLPLPINIDAGCFYKNVGLGTLCVLNMDEKTVRFQERVD